MIAGVIALGGWTASSLAVAVAVVVWRSRAAQMEAVVRACHELRGSLTAVRLGLQLGARTGELSQGRLRAVDLELGRAALALEDLASASRRPAQARPAHAIDVAELLVDSVEACRPDAERRRVQLQVKWSGGRSRVVGDRLRLAQATCNLIANAIEYGGEAVEVRGRGVRRSVRVEVTDRGPGLPAPVAELVRAAHGGRGQRGRGLAIAAAVAAEHGGRLAAAPSERGARLVLELPAAPTVSGVRGIA